MDEDGAAKFMCKLEVGMLTSDEFLGRMARDNM
jgi:hypothetical protein